MNDPIWNFWEHAGHIGSKSITQLTSGITQLVCEIFGKKKLETDMQWFSKPFKRQPYKMVTYTETILR